MPEMGIKARNLDGVCKALDKIVFLKVQDLPSLLEPEQYLTSHTADFTIEGSTAIKTL